MRGKFIIIIWNLKKKKKKKKKKSADPLAESLKNALDRQSAERLP